MRAHGAVQMRNKMMALILVFSMALSGVSLTVASTPMSRNEKTLLW